MEQKKKKTGDEESVKSRTRQMAYHSENESQSRNIAQKEMSDELHRCLHGACNRHRLLFFLLKIVKVEVNN